MRIEFSDEQKDKIKESLERSLPANTIIDSNLLPHIFKTFKQGEEREAKNLALCLNFFYRKNHPDLAVLMTDYLTKNINSSESLNVVKSLITVKNLGVPLSEIEALLKEYPVADDLLLALFLKMPPKLAAGTRREKKEEIMDVLLSYWKNTIPGSDLVLISFGSADERIRSGDAAEQREPHFVKEARKNGKIVSVLNIDPQFSTDIVKHGQSTLSSPFTFCWDEKDCANLEKFNVFLNNLLKTTPVVIADYLDGIPTRFKKMFESGIDPENLKKLSLILGWTASFPVFLIKPSEMQIPDRETMPFRHSDRTKISDDETLQRLNQSGATAFLNLAQIPLSAIDIELSISTQKKTKSSCEPRLFTASKNSDEDTAEAKTELDGPKH